LFKAEVEKAITLTNLTFDHCVSGGFLIVIFFYKINHILGEGGAFYIKNVHLTASDCGI
jgi:hypothetical protein